MRYDIITLTHNNAQDVRSFVCALAGADYPAQQLNLIFADLGSCDGTVQALTELNQEFAQFGGFTVLSCTGNTGCAAKSAGAAKGGAPLVLFLDVRAQASRDLFCALDKTIASAPESAGAFECRLLPFGFEKACNPVTMETAFVHSRALCVRRSALEQTGSFDARFPDAFADRDFSMRMRAAGFSLFLAPHASAALCESAADTPGLIEYADDLAGTLLMHCKFGSFGSILRGHAQYLAAMRHPVHFDGVRRTLASNYLHAVKPCFSLFFHRFSHREEYRSVKALPADVFCRPLGRFALPQTHSTPLISVIVRTCKRPDILRATLQSLRHQTYKNFEIVVTEDGEPASHSMICEEFSDLPIRYLNDGICRGRAENGNRGLRCAQGELCCFLDDDDFFYPDHLELLNAVFSRHPKADMVLGSAGALFVTRDGHVTELRPMVFDRIDRFTMCQNCRIPIETVLFRRSLFEKYGGMPAELDAHEDWAMWLRYLEHAKRITPHRPDIGRITSVFVQPAHQADADARISAYSASDDAFYGDESLRFDVSLADMRRYYDDMIRDMQCLEARGELHDFLIGQAGRSSHKER